jgi:hypothetical protein
LYVCGRNACPATFSDAKATHNTPLNNEVCKAHTGVPLDYCTDGIVTPFNRYFCCIIGGPGGPPFEDAFIEWFYYIETNNAAQAYVTGKFTFMANKNYIKNVWDAHGYPGPVGNGIPLFNPSNHNQ